MLAAAESGKYGLGSSIADDSDKLQETFRDKGIDTRHISQDFLEESELGDSTSLKQYLDSLSKEDALQFTRRVDQQGSTGLLLAARRGDVALCDVLLDAGANVNAADGQGVRALHYAAGRSSTSLLGALLRAGAETDALDDVGETALFWAAGSGCVECMQCLLDAGADRAITNRRGETALMNASRRGAVSAIEMLGRLQVEEGTISAVDLDRENSLGQSAHDLACMNGQYDAAAALVRLGAKPSSDTPVQALSGVSGLHEAAACGDAEAVREILGRNEVSADAPFKGETPLLRAASAGHTLVVEALLDSQADPERPDDFHGETPMWRAVLHHRLEVVWILLNAGAKPSTRVGGRTPLQLAESWNFGDVADLLRIKTGGKALGVSVHEKVHWGGPVPQIDNRPPESEESRLLTAPIRTMDNPAPPKPVEAPQKNALIEPVESRTETTNTNVARAQPDSRSSTSIGGEFADMD